MSCRLPPAEEETAHIADGDLAVLPSPAMLSMKLLIRFIDSAFLLRVFLLLMLYSLVPLGEIVLIIFLVERYGMYLVLAGLAATSLVGLFMAHSRVRVTLRALRAQVRSGTYPREEFACLAGVFVGGVLIVTPGFATDALGLLFLLPAFRKLVGRAVTSRMENRLKELYEYLKMYDV